MAEWHCAALEKRCPQGLGGSNPPPSALENPIGSNPCLPQEQNPQKKEIEKLEKENNENRRKNYK